MIVTFEQIKLAKDMIMSELRKQKIITDETASASGMAIEATVTILVIALVLIPVGLVTLAGTNITTLSATERTVIGTLGVITVAGIAIAIIKSAASGSKK